MRLPCIVVHGLPTTGKTEAIKMLTSYSPVTMEPGLLPGQIIHAGVYLPKYKRKHNTPGEVNIIRI